ncbi:hypothetical protein ABZ714_24775 [Streptomyces sp. NPDC006798]|uniref:hypothetical protein n=1 Tax=Streptomyces sp. NPDC006798 TaxID=3155462 RepID=UPI0034058BBB
MQRTCTRRARFRGAAGGAFQQCGEASVGVAEDGFGGGAAAVASGRGGGVALDSGGQGAGVPGEVDLVARAGGTRWVYRVFVERERVY